MPEEHDYAMERRLQQLDPELHRRFTDSVFALQYNLSNYKLIFPDFTDHTILHSLSVIDFCNKLMGDQINRLNKDEIYVLLMGSYFHDTGMGITHRNFDDFSAAIDFGDYFCSHSREDYPTVIRDFHQEYSGLFIQKYADLFEIPSDEHVRAIVQIARGHRRTDLMDETEYPVSFALPDGNTVCLPYLAALIRLADEIDVAAPRNPVLLYDIEALTDDVQILENKKLKAVRELRIDEESFTLRVEESDRIVLEAVRNVAVKMQRTLDECRAAVHGRTPYTITQSRVIVEKIY